MRKQLSLLIAAGLAASLFAVPSAAFGARAAAKKKKIQDSFSAQLLPFPGLQAIRDPLGLERPGCLSGQEDVNWMRVPFDPPAAGTLTATTEGFQGDWDLHLTDENGKPLVSSQEQQVGTAPAPPKEQVQLRLRANQPVNIEVCNWAGEPQNEVEYEFVYVAKGKHKNH
jgi:hypothetical protein